MLPAPLRRPDLVGFGKSDKPADRFAYTYQRHADRLNGTVLDRLDLRGITMVCHDWGGLLGLRLLAEHRSGSAASWRRTPPCPPGTKNLGAAFTTWLQLSQRDNPFDIGQVIDRGTVTELHPAVRAACNAPFPDESYLPDPSGGGRGERPNPASRARTMASAREAT